MLYFFTGTGKTATFSISILQQIDTSNHECQALILAPTRELAQQVLENAYFACLLLLYLYIFFCGIYGAHVLRIQNCEWWDHMCRFYRYLLLCQEGGGHACAYLNQLVAWCRCVVQDDLSPICFVVYPLQIGLPLWNACFVMNTFLNCTFVAYHVTSCAGLP